MHCLFKDTFVGHRIPLSLSVSGSSISAASGSGINGSVGGNSFTVKPNKRKKKKKN